MSVVQFYTYDPTSVDSDGLATIASSGRGLVDQSLTTMARDGHVFVTMDDDASRPIPGRHRVRVATGEFIEVDPSVKVGPPPPQLPDRSDPKVKAEDLKVICQQAIEEGFKSNALGELHQYGASPTDQTNLLLGGPQRCCDEKGVWALRDHTSEQLEAVKIAFISHRDTARGRLDLLNAVLQAATTKQEIDDIRWSDNRGRLLG